MSQEASNKEPFDYERLVKLLWNKVRDIPPAEELERRYCVTYGDRIQTLAEFAEALYMAEVYDGGDMHLD